MKYFYIALAVLLLTAILSPGVEKAPEYSYSTSGSIVLEESAPVASAAPLEQKDVAHFWKALGIMLMISIVFIVAVEFFFFPGAFENTIESVTGPDHTSLWNQVYTAAIFVSSVDGYVSDEEKAEIKNLISEHMDKDK